MPEIRFSFKSTGNDAAQSAKPSIWNWVWLVGTLLLAAAKLVEVFAVR